MIDETEARLAALRASADQGEKYYNDRLDHMVETYREVFRADQLSRVEAIAFLSYELLVQEEHQPRIVLCSELAVAIDRLSRVKEGKDEEQRATDPTCGQQAGTASRDKDTSI
jgi:hypothetical protein